MDKNPKFQVTKPLYISSPGTWEIWEKKKPSLVPCYPLREVSFPVGVTWYKRSEWRENRMTESQEQKQLIQWCRTDPRFQYLFHIPNESVGGQGWIIRNRQMGVRPGVPDLFYPVPMNGYHGMFIEMKAGKGRLSPDQRRWIKALETLGYRCVVAHGWEEARTALEEYIG